MQPIHPLKLNYLELHTDLPIWMLVMVHDLLRAIANLTGHHMTAFGPLSAKESEVFHEQAAAT